LSSARKVLCKSIFDKELSDKEKDDKMSTSIQSEERRFQKKMSTDQLRVLGAGLSFLLILLSGFWLSRSGKPYSTIVFNIHKLVAVAAVVLLGITVYRIHRAGALSAIELLAVIVTGLFFLGTMVTGGLLSIPIDKAIPAIVHKLHQVTPYLTVLSTVATLWFLRG
jgi:cation transport ATPase